MGNSQYFGNFEESLPCAKRYHLMQKLELDWKGIFPPVAEDMKVCLTPSKALRKSAKKV